MASTSILRLQFIPVLTCFLACQLSAAVKNPDTFVYLSNSEPETLDPAWSYDADSHNAISNLYDYLLAYAPGVGASRDLVPSISEAVPSIDNGLISSDRLSYRFPIRKGVHFQDGSLLTPEDVRYSLLRFMLFDRDGGPSSLLLYPILGVRSTRERGKPIPGLYERAEGVVRVEGDSLVVRLRRPYAPFLSILAGFGAVQSKAWCAAHGQWDGRGEDWKRYSNPKIEEALPKDVANGTGAFKLERYDKVGRQLILARFDAHWRGPARLSRVVIKTVPEFSTRRLMLQAGDADSIVAPSMYSSQLRGLSDVEIIEGLACPELDPFLIFNFKIDPAGNRNIGSGRLDGGGIPPNFFVDKRVREAFARSIDYDAYIRDVLKGQGRAIGSFIPAGLLGSRPNRPAYPYDPAKAAILLHEAWSGRVWKNGFRLTMPYVEGNDDLLALYRIIQKGLESLNSRFKIDILPVQLPVMIQDLRARRLPIAVEGWDADYLDPDNFAFPLLHSQGFWSSSFGYVSPKADHLVEAAASVLDEGERVKLYGQLQNLVDEDIPFVPVAQKTYIRAQKSWVKGFRFRPIFPAEPWSSWYYEIYKHD